MIQVCPIKFKKTGKAYFFDMGTALYNQGDEVIVETVRGQELGVVAQAPFGIKEEELKNPLKKIIGLATEEQKQQYLKFKLEGVEAFDIARVEIKKLKLDMKLVDVEYTLDGSKIIFYFTSDGRVDFRELVKTLSAVFKRRIEMHQIGSRDATKICGALGHCGKPTCCSTFLSNFNPVAITMAKEQNISLNPIKISGMCGRLMCCLVYEDNVYKEILARMPRVESEVIYQDKVGRVVEVNALKETVVIQMPEDRTKIEVPAAEVRKVTAEDREKFPQAPEDKKK